MKYYSGRGQGNIDQKMHEKFFKDKTDGVCIECGALDGKSLSICACFDIHMGWKSYNIEANPYSFEQLCKNRPNAVNVKAALSNTDDEVVRFHASPKPKLSFVVTPQNGGYVKDRSNIVTANTMTYKTFIKEHDISVVDLFVLDIEGLEPQAIEGMIGCDVLPSVFCIETKPEHRDLIENKLTLLNKPYVEAFRCSYNTVYIPQDS